MKLCWSLAIAIVALSIISTTAKAESSDLWEEDDKEVLIRSIRGTKERTSGSTTTKASACRYTKGEWTECDTNLNIRTRVLTLKKGDKNNCEEKKTIRKKCKKACRYEKGTWSSCANHKTTRIDHLKNNSDPSCEKTRETTRNCKPETNTKKSTKGDRSNKKTGGKQ